MFPLLCMCTTPPPKKWYQNELFENGKMSWTAFLETNKLNSAISQVPGYGLAIHRTLMLVKMVPLVQTTSSKALVFPACLGFHTTAWGDVHLLGHLL